MPGVVLMGMTGVIWLLLFSTPVGAQEEEVSTEVPAREAAAAADAKDAAAAARARRALEPHDAVSLADVFADPDNLDLNFRYAKAQIARGDLLGAAATLERILLINPDLTRARLLYGVVLFRLDNLEEAERTLKAVREQPMPDSLRREVDGYLKEISLRRKLTRFSASYGVGYQFDSNRNAAPSSKQRLFVDTPLGLTGNSRKRRDTSFVRTGSLGVTHDLGFQAGHELFASLHHFNAEQTVVDDLDLAAFTMEGGGVFKSRLVDITLVTSANHIFLSRETFLRTQGGGVTVEGDFTKTLHGALSAHWTREDYVPIAENLAARERNGERTTVDANVRYVLSPTMRLAGGVGFVVKGAKASYNEYDGINLDANYTWLLGKGQFFISSLSYAFNKYDTPDTAISATLREDRQLRTRLVYGAPLGLFVAPLAAWIPPLEDITATVTYEQFWSDSNVTNYKYRNSKFGTMLTKRVEF